MSNAVRFSAIHLHGRDELRNSGRFALVSLSANANIDEFCGMRAELARVLTAARADRVNVTGGSRTARSRAKSRVRAFPAALSGRARRAVASPARCELAL